MTIERDTANPKMQIPKSKINPSSTANYAKKSIKNMRSIN